MMKIYTKQGDDGQTGLVGGSRTNKDDIRIETALVRLGGHTTAPSPASDGPESMELTEQRVRFEFLDRASELVLGSREQLDVRQRWTLGPHANVGPRRGCGPDPQHGSVHAPMGR